MMLYDLLQILLAVVLSYLLGSVPTGLLLGLWLRGVDIRQHGSCNIGATNTLRVLGKGLGITALVVDILKGAIPVLLIARLTPWEYAPLACGVAAVLGHIFPVYIKFRGGKGVATAAGVFASLAPVPTLIALVVFATTVALTRMVSAGSILGAVTLAVAVYALPNEVATAPTHLLPDDWTLEAIVTIIALLVLWRHRSNIRRILTGQENRLGQQEAERGED